MFLIDFGTIFGACLDVFLTILSNKNKMMSGKVLMTLQEAKAMAKNGPTIIDNAARGLCNGGPGPPPKA